MFKRIVSLFIAVIMLVSVLSAIPAHAAETEGICGDNLTWRFSSQSGTLTILGEGEMYDYNWDSIKPAPWLEYRSKIKTVILGTGVTSIGKYSFAECTELVNISFPMTVTEIGACAFADCISLKSIIIPDNVTSIGSEAFIYCTSLEKVVIGSGVTEISYSVFWDCTSLYDVTLGRNITTIRDGAFYNCESYENIVLPEACINLSYDSFYGTAYYDNEENWEDGILYLGTYLLCGGPNTPDRIIIKVGTEYVARMAFEMVDPSRIYYPRSIKHVNGAVCYLIYFGGSKTPYYSPHVFSYVGTPTDGGTYHHCPVTGKCGDSMYYSFDETGTVLTFYGNGAMKDYDYNYDDYFSSSMGMPWEHIDVYVDKVVIKGGVTSVDDDALPRASVMDMSELEKTHIGSNEFYCYSSKLILPDNLEYICYDNFSYYVSEIVISENNSTYTTEDGVLYSKDMTTLYQYPSSRKGEHFDVPEGVDTIGEYAVLGLKNLKTIYIPESVKNIDVNALSKSLTIQCRRNSAAHQFAVAKGYKYEIICEHNFGEYTATPATCTKDGYMSAECTKGCGFVDVIVDEGSAFGHSFTDYVCNDDATCTEDATSTALCENGCGTTDIRTEQGTALGHLFTSYTVVSAADCVNNEVRESHCERNCGAVETVEVEGSTLDHRFLIYTYNNNATCTKDGTSYSVCENGCGTTDIRVDEGSAFGHSFIDYEVVVAADCLHDEVKQSYCDRDCGAVDVIVAEGSAWGHSFTEFVYGNDESCVEDGTMTANCDHGCGAVYTYIAEGTAHGHSFTSYEILSTQSCIEDGVKEAYCDHGCGAKDVITEKAFGHTLGDWIVTEEATYDSEGWKIQNCTVCNEVINTQAIPKLVYEGFPDIWEDSWYAEGVEYCYKNGYMVGTDKGLFEPNAELTREQLVVILARISGADLSGYTESSFTDVKAGSWYGPAVIWAGEMGIVKGVGNGRFGVRQNIDRESLATLFYRYAQKQGTDVSGKSDLTGYSDYTKISSWSQDACAWAVNTGLLSSTSTKRLTLSPKMAVTRAQAAKIFMSYDKIK